MRKKRDTGWVDARTAAAHLGLCVRTVWRRARAGEIPCAKVGGSYRFSLDDLDAWLRKHCMTTRN